MSCSSSEKSTDPSPWPGGVTYEIFVQSFADSNGDGIGDLRGIIQQIDYLESLGIDAVWLMPIHPAPSYHKYDVQDYFQIHPDYGTLEDFKELVEELHQRDIRILLDLVLNHTSDLHPWFQEARKGPNNPYRPYYVWSNDPQTLAKHPEWEWHEVNKSRAVTPSKVTPDSSEQYYGFFWHEMPDLNFEYTPLHEELFQIGEFWVAEMGVDGFRLDAAKFLYGEAHPQKNIAFWKSFLDRMRQVNPHFFMVGEVWDSPLRLAPYFEGIPGLFNFHAADLLVQTAKTGKDSIGLVSELIAIQSQYAAVHPGFIDATFLRNHDQNRVSSDLSGSKGRARVAANLLLSLPGSPFIYYGEELGMLGKKPDEDIREPIPWDLPGSSSLQTSWRAVKYNTSNAVSPYSIQQQDSLSLYWHYRRLINFRKQSPVLKLGSLHPGQLQLPGVLDFVRRYQNRSWQVIHNLSGRRKKVPFSSQNYRLVFRTSPTTTWTSDSLELGTFSMVILEEN